MKASLVSREIIADSIELVGRGHLFDTVVALVGCDKTIPGAAMALIQLNVPGLVLYGGSIAPGHFRGKDVTVGDVYEAIGAHAAGKMSDADLRGLIVGHIAPEAALGGPMAALQEGDSIVIDIEARRLDVELAEAEIAARLANWVEPAPRYTSGVFAKYAALVSSASEGAITRPPL